MADSLTFLGTAANGGVPQLDCRCSQCLGPQRRLRSSLLFELNGQKWVIDAGPDFKTQLEAHSLKSPDLQGIILSHLHADHCAGLSELGFGKPHRVSVFSHPKVISDLLTHQSFGFLFKNGFAKLEDKPEWLNFTLIPHDPAFPTIAIVIKHNQNQIFIASDIAKIDRGVKKLIFQSQIVIIDGTFLNESAHWHQSIRATCEMLRNHPGRVFFTHVNHSEDNETIVRHITGFNFKLAHDNLKIEI